MTTDLRFAAVYDDSLTMVDPSTLTSAAVASIASHGLLGVILIIVGWVAWSKDRDLQAERLARIDDAKAYTDLALKLQAQFLDAVNRVTNTFDEMKKIMAGRTSTGGGR